METPTTSSIATCLPGLSAWGQGETPEGFLEERALELWSQTKFGEEPRSPAVALQSPLSGRHGLPTPPLTSRGKGLSIQTNVMLDEEHMSWRIYRAFLCFCILGRSRWRKF